LETSALLPKFSEFVFFVFRERFVFIRGYSLEIIRTGTTKLHKTTRKKKHENFNDFRKKHWPSIFEK